MPFLHGIEILEVTTGSQPITTLSSSVIGIVGTAPAATGGSFPINTPTVVTSPLDYATLGTTGTLPDALNTLFSQGGAVVVVVRVAEGANLTETTANVLGGVNSTTGNYEGVEALKSARSVTGFAPRLILAPGFTHQRTTTANAVAAKLVVVAEALRAIALVDAPNTTDAAAITYAGDFSSRRAYIVDPFVLMDKAGVPTAMPTSPAVAGVIARVDNEVGFWASPSNHEVRNVLGLARPVDWSVGSTTSRANVLNEAKVTTLIRDGGYRLWGNRTASGESKWAFLSVVRTADMINDSIQNGLKWAQDRGITKTLVEDVVTSVNNYLADLRARGAIINGKAWADPALNSPTEVAQGHLTIDFDFAPAYPAERITMRSTINNGYITEVFS
jgi:phage tail sheath protein FI